MIGIIVSGSAVPTAASTDPTAPSARLELAAEPLDAVGEQLGAEQDDEERDDEDEEVHSDLRDEATPTTPRAMTTRMPMATSTMAHSPPRAYAMPDGDRRGRSAWPGRRPSPSHRKPLGSSARMSAGIAPGSNGGAAVERRRCPTRASGADADDEERRPRRRSCRSGVRADHAVRSRASTGPGRVSGRHPSALASIWNAV